MTSRILSITLLLALSITMCSCGGDMKIGDLRWSQEGSTCRVTFSTKNTGSEPISRSASIVAKHREIGTYGTVIFDVVGEKEIQLNLTAGEEKQIKETLQLKMNLRPSMVTVELSDVE